ncbi:hypothetical protein GCM10009650_24460 [Nesterenkonia jeotgali]
MPAENTTPAISATLIFGTALSSLPSSYGRCSLAMPAGDQLVPLVDMPSPTYVAVTRFCPLHGGVAGTGISSAPIITVTGHE